MFVYTIINLIDKYLFTQLLSYYLLLCSIHAYLHLVVRVSWRSVYVLFFFNVVLNVNSLGFVVGLVDRPDQPLWNTRWLSAAIRTLSKVTLGAVDSGAYQVNYICMFIMLVCLLA